MQRKTLLLIGMVLLLSLYALVLATPSYKYTFLSGDFNATSYTAKALNKTYASGFEAVVYNKLVYNATTGGDAYITLSDDNAGITDSIQLVMTNDSRLEITVYLAGTSELIYNKTATFKDGAKSIVVSIDNENLLDVGTSTDGDTYVSNFAFGSFNCTYVLAKGSTTFVTESGYVSVTFSGYMGIAGFNFTEWIPVFMSLAMLSIVVGMVKKMGR